MKVCILGDGLSCLALAKALVNQKIRVDNLINKKKQKVNYSRTLGISKKNIDYINKSIINIEKIHWRLKKIEIFSENLKNEKLLNFENNDNYLFSIIKNYKLQELLKRSLSKDKYFRSIDEKKKIILNSYDLIINTEFNNFLTKKYFSKKIEKKYNSIAYTTTIKHNKILNNIATQIFTKKGPLAFLPISNNETSIVYSLNENFNPRENIQKLIEKYNFKYRIKKINKFETFKLKAVTLREYCNSNILAFGDLLHRVHPLAGQGFNMTIRDIIVLMKIIDQRINLGLPIDKSVGKEFEQKTRHTNFIFSNGIDFIYEFFNFERKINIKGFSKSVQTFGKNTRITKMITKLADEGLVY